MSWQQTSSEATVKTKQMRKFTLLTQSTYYLLTGIWPVIHLPSFMAVTGSKTDIWLVEMVALLTIAISIQLIAHINYKQSSPTLAVTTALSFLVIDSHYALNGTISKIYLGDAAVQLAFLIALILLWLKKTSNDRHASG